MWEEAHQIYFLVFKGHSSELGLTDKALTCLFAVRIAGATRLSCHLCPQRYPVIELEKSQTRRGLLQETEAVVPHPSLQVSVENVDQKVLGEGAASLLIQKDFAEISQCPDFSPASLPCRLWYLREWLCNEEQDFPPLLTLKHDLERGDVALDLTHIC